MIRKAFEPYLQMFVDNTKFDLGLGVMYWPAVVWFDIWAVLMRILSPLRLGEALLCFINKKNRRESVIEFIGSKNHLLVANKVCLSRRTRVTFNVKDSRGDSIHLSAIVFVLIAHLYAHKIVRALLDVQKDPRVRKNSIRVIKTAAIAVLGRSLMKNKKVLLQYNDHSPYSVMLRLVAESLDLKTVYVQHAPVSDRFPRLEHNLIGLFGRDSVEKYIKKGISPGKEIFIITDVRFPARHTLPKGGHDEILVCCNLVDDLNAVRACVSAFITRGYKVRLRPHPQDKRRLPRMPGVKVSRSLDIWTDLSHACAVIANESAVHLEAAYFCVNTFKLITFSRSFDNYGFLKHSLIKKEYPAVQDLIVDLEAGVQNFNEDVVEYFTGDIAKSKLLLDAFRQKIEIMSI